MSVTEVRPIQIHTSQLTVSRKEGLESRVRYLVHKRSYPDMSCGSVKVCDGEIFKFSALDGDK